MDVEVLIEAKCKNAILAKLVDQYGSIKDAAEEVGVSGATLSAWLNFKWSPVRTHNLIKRTVFLQRIIPRLEELTGRNIKEIFPDMPKEAYEILSRPRAVEKKISTQAITSAIEREKLSYEDDVESRVDNAMAREDIEKAMETLTPREREIVKMHYGFGDDYSYTFKEIGRVFGVTQEKVGQILEKAICKLQQPHRAQHLVRYLD